MSMRAVHHCGSGCTKDVSEGSSLQEKLGQREVRPDRMQGTNQSVEAGRQPIQVSAGEAGQGRRPGMDDVLFGIATERLKYKWMSCTDSEWKPRKAVSLLAEVPWGDRSSLRGKEPGWIKNLCNFQILFSASPLLIWEKEVWLSIRRFWDRTSPREEVKLIIRNLETGQSLWLHLVLQALVSPSGKKDLSLENLPTPHPWVVGLA